MAIIDDAEKAKIRQFISTIGAADYDKPTINSAMQAIEDWFEGERLTISSEIDLATSPQVLTNQQKKLLGAIWMLKKHGRELL
jgi:hypothetical protein